MLFMTKFVVNRIVEGRNIKPSCVYTSNSKSINIKMNLFSIYDINIIHIEKIFIN
jgi:hypothetical protein